MFFRLLPAGAGQADPAVVAAGRRSLARDPAAAGQVVAGQASADRTISSGVPWKTTSPAALARPGPISMTHWSAARIIASSCSTTTTVLPRSRSASDGVHQSVDVGRVQPDRRLVQHVEHVDQARAEGGGQGHAPGLAAAERPQRAVERQVAQPDRFQVAQPGIDLFEHHHGRPAAASR